MMLVFIGLIKDSYLDHFGVETLSQFDSSVGDEYRAILVNVHKSAGLQVKKNNHNSDNS